MNSQLLSLLFDAQASELSSRMSAMKAATDNAKECRGTGDPRGPGHGPGHVARWVGANFGVELGNWENLWGSK